MSWQRQPPRFGVLNPELIPSVCFYLVDVEYLPALEPFRVPPIERERRGCARRRRSATASSASHARAAFALQTAPIAAPRGRTVELGAFSLRHPSPRATRLCPFLPPPSARPNLASPSRFSRIRDGCPRRRAASARAASGHRCRAQKGEAGEARQAAAEQAPRRPDGHTTGAGALDVAKAAAKIPSVCLS